MDKILLVTGLGLVIVGLVIAFALPGTVETYYQTGTASWYGSNFDGEETASGEIFDMSEMTAAHKSLPFGTKVKVVNLENGRSVVVRINDRGPFIKGRIIDLSRAAAEKLGLIRPGTAKVGLVIKDWG